MSEPEPTLEEPQRPRSKWRPVKGWAIFILVLLIISVVNHNIALNEYILAPGGATPAKQFIDIGDNKAMVQNGKVLTATVAITQATPLDWLLAHVQTGTSIYSKKKLLGPQTTQSQYNAENEDELNDSQLTAITYAMTRAGYSVKLLGDGADIAAIQPGAPADGKLNVNDIITSADGISVSTAQDLVDAIQKNAKVGDVAKLQVKNAQNQTNEVDITLKARPDDGQNDGTAGQPYIGVALETKNPHLQTPFPVSFKDTNFGGPSAGAAFTLTLLDELTPGQLTGGQTIAVTGTISTDGTIGPVGGVKQKTHAVEAAGAKIFLVPPDEYNDAKKAANKHLTVISVSTIDQAVAAMASHGGDASGIPADTTPVAPS